MSFRRHERQTTAPLRDKAGKVVGVRRSNPAVVASAAIIRRSQIRSLTKAGSADWQRICWDYYDSVGELRYGVGWLANALSRARLYVGDAVEAEQDEETTDDPAPTQNLLARVPLRELFSGATGHGQMLARLAVHLSVPGESYLVGFDRPVQPPAGPLGLPVDGEPADTERVWLVCTADEFDVRSRDVRITLPDTGEKVVIDLDNATVLRLWRPHARFAWNADTALRAALSTCKEIADLSAHVSASAESRLAGAGMLVVPQSATVHAPAMPPTDGQPSEVHPDPLIAGMIESMVVPVTDRDAASAVVPFLLKVADESIGKVKHITFSTPLDANTLPLREAAIGRLATALDVPAEVILGMGDSNHWSAWQIEESSIKLHIEPLLQTICDALTTQFLWPALEALGVENPQAYVIWYDVSKLAMRPNQGQAALALEAVGLVAAGTARRENGFSDDDAPTATERIMALLEKLAVAGNVDAANKLVDLYRADAADDEQVPDIGTLEAPAVASPAPPGGDGGGGPGDGSADGRADRGLPAREEQAAPAAASMAWQLGVLEAAVLRALDKAGKHRLSTAGRAERGRHTDIEPWQLHTRLPVPVGELDRVLAGAWAWLDELLPDAGELREAADQYVRALLTTGTGHERRYLYDTLRAAGALPAVREVAAIGA